MNPDMSLGQWLLVTLTAGVSGGRCYLSVLRLASLLWNRRGGITLFSPT